MERKNKAESGAGGLRLTVITPEEEFFDGMVESVVVRTLDGYMGFLENRASACVMLHDEGVLQFRRAGAEPGNMVKAILSGGFAFMDEEMTIYTDYARWPESADPAEAKAELSAFQQAMASGEKIMQERVRKLQPDTEPLD